MPERKIYHLLSNYADKTISPEELNELRILVDLSDDEELSLILQGMWNAYQVKQEPDKQILAEVLGEVKSSIDRHTVRHTIRRMAAIAAIFLLPLLATYSAYMYYDKVRHEKISSHDLVVEVDKGQRAGLVLPDGTRVRLNSGSLFSYKQDFGHERRKVNLSGEAYFEVKKDAGKPFVVHTKHLDIEVLGTSFNVYCYEKENIMEMALVSGQIKVVTNTYPPHTIYLKPNEKALFNKTSGHLAIEKTDNRFETAWLRGALVFRSVRMDEVVLRLERRYGVTIHWNDPAIKNDLFTGSFDSEHIAEVMEILQTHYDFTFRIVSNDIYISAVP